MNSINAKKPLQYNSKYMSNFKKKKDLCCVQDSGRVDRVSGTETVDSGSIPGRVKPKTIKIGIHSFPV